MQTNPLNSFRFWVLRMALATRGRTRLSGGEVLLWRVSFDFAARGPTADLRREPNDRDTELQMTWRAPFFGSLAQKIRPKLSDYPHPSVSQRPIEQL